MKQIRSIFQPATELLTRLMCLGLLVASVLTANANANPALARPANLAPVILSLSPTSGTVGTVVTLSCQSTSGTSAVRFNGLASGFVVINATTIRATVPGGATTGSVTFTAGGLNSNGLPFTVLPTPAITSLQPGGGPVGTVVVVKGNFLSGVTGAKFNGVAATAFSLTSTTTATATVPAGATTGNLTLTTAGVASNGLLFAVGPLPVITSFSPGVGPVGSTVLLTGTNLTGTYTVRFNGSGASFTVLSATSISAVVPAGATTGTISLATPIGATSSAGTFVVGAPFPSISALSPSSGPVGTVVTITGLNLLGTSSVLFGGTPAAFTVLNATTATATVPNGLGLGLAVVTLTTPGGSYSFNGFTVVVAAPVITSISPTSGPEGTLVYLTGLNLLGTTSVSYGTMSAAFTVVDATTVKTEVPVGIALGLAVVTLTTPGGSYSYNGFTVTAPLMRALAPAQLLAQGRTAIYPNPTTEVAQVEVSGLPTIVAALQATLLASNGLVAGYYTLPVAVGKAATALPTAGLLPGNYLLRLTALDAEGAAVGKLPVQRLNIR